jgi:hypothetical protein
LIGRVWDISSAIGPFLGGLCKYYANAGGKRLIQRQPFLVQYQQQANPLLSVNNYTPLGISRKEKNKQITLLSPANGKQGPIPEEIYQTLLTNKKQGKTGLSTPR